MELSVFLYCPTGQIIIPGSAKTEAGYYLETEPVEVASRSDANAVIEALKRAASRTIFQVPTPTKFDSKSPSVKAAGAKTWSDFERNALLWHLAGSSEAGYQIERWISFPRQSGFVPDPNRIEQVPQPVSLEDLFKKFLVLVDAACAEECE